ncbi:MAG: hypothetical protein K0R65_852 [Crocinitomicaceae bacterium]|jgi:RHS repeat-associated protein|nr:hypothetical protein [Crocinitomicaceae bacterium]
MKKNFILGLGLFLAGTFSTQAQIVGGTGNSEMTPKAAEPSKLTTGNFQGDVNLFTGDYNTSYPLGTVATPSGLSFTLTYSYSSAFTIGATPQVFRGIPYGEGWNLNIPTISVETDVFNNFASQAVCDEGGTLGTPLHYTATGAGKEGDVYWLSPEINIPGVASGRGVFKYVDVADDKTPVFVLNEFENPVEIRFKSGRWEVLVSDGTKYVFSKAIKSVRAPSNARTLFYNRNDLSTNNAVSDRYLFDELNSDVVNNMMPKESYNVWYCEQITNLNYYQQTISFVYDTYGAFNYYQEFLQPAFKQALAEFGTVSTFAFDADFTVYTDLVLKEVVSSAPRTPIDKLVLNYKTNGFALTQSEAIDFRQDLNAVRIDSLYTATPVYSSGAANQFNGWKRYNHCEKTGSPSSMSGSSNPYQSSNGFFRDFVPSVNKIPFDHGYLESERIPSAELFPGDIYEIRTRLTRNNNDETMGNGTLDIAVVTGNYESNYASPNGATISDAGNNISSENYNKIRGIELYSTFNMALKWQMSNGENAKQTSNFFVMPNIPESFKGINIQVGPGNSDTDYGYNTQSQFYNDFLLRENNTTVHYNAVVPYSFVTLGSGLKSAATIPHNFGVGLPWSNMLPLVKRMAQSIPQVTENIFEPIHPYFDFWWTHNAQDIANGNNRPTKFDNQTFLDEFELIRYSKNPFMLESVEMYHLNGDEQAGGWVLTGKKQFTYDVNRIQMAENFAYPSNDNVARPLYLNSHFQVQILLKSISEVPIDYNYTANDTTLLQTTFFGYEKFIKDVTTYYKLLPNTGYPGMVLNTVVNPLGGITRIIYYNYNNALTYSNFNFTRPQSCGNPTPPYGYSEVVDVHPVVHYIVENDQDNRDLTQFSNHPLSNRTEYIFDNSTVTAIDKKLNYTNNSFRNRSNHNNYTGFGKVIVKTAKLNSGEQNETHYEHFTDLDPDPLDPDLSELEKYLYFGKMKSIKSYDSDGKIHEEKLYRYENTLAFENGYLRPNPYREHISYEEKYYDPLLNPYEYRDYYLQEFVTQSGLTGETAYPLLDIPRFRGSGEVLEMPKFLEFEYFRMLETHNPAYKMNSYFVRMAEEINKTYENFLWRASQGVVNPNGPGTTQISNPNGNGHSNTTNANNDVTQLALLTGNNPSANSASATLIAASPLSETVLEGVMNTVKFNAQQKTNILLAQNGLSNNLWEKVLLNEKRFTPPQLLSLIDRQSYFADATLLKLIELNHKNLDPKVFEAMLLKKEFLSNQVMLAMLNTQGYMGSKSFTEVFIKQPHMTEEILVKLVESPYVVVNSLPDALKPQNITDLVYQKLVDRTDVPGNVLATIIENDPVFPSEQSLLHLLDRTPKVEHENLKRIFATANREIEASVEQKLKIKEPNENKQKEILGQTVRLNPLNLYCNNELQLTREFIETKTTYEYYEADYKGSTTGEAYKTLLALGEFPRTIDMSDMPFGDNSTRVIDKVYLKHEPSFQLFRKKTTSIHQPGAYNEEQHFYTYDLKNRYDRYWFNYDVLNGGNSKAGVDIYSSGDLQDTLGYNLNWDQDYWRNLDHIYILPKFDAMTHSQERNMRNLPFQTTVFTKNATDQEAVMKSEYFHYDSRVDVNINYTFLEEHTDGPDCPTETPDPVTGCDACRQEKYPHTDYFEGLLMADLPYNYCLWEAPNVGYYICPAEYTINPCDPQAIKLNCNPSILEEEPSGIGENEGPNKMILLGTGVKNTLQLKRRYMQVDDVSSDQPDFLEDRIDSDNNYIMELYIGAPNSIDENGYAIDYKERLPFANLKTSEITKRNAFLQPEITVNQVGLKTRFYYNEPVQTRHINDNCAAQNYTTVNFENIGKPVRVTIGYGRADSISTTYAYSLTDQLSKITLPSGHYTEYTFDGFLRLKQVMENGTRLLSRTEYKQWKHNFNLNFQQRTTQNYVHSIQYNEYINTTDLVDTNQREIAKAFVDPLGREYSVSRNYGLNYLYSGTIRYDRWGRVIKSNKPTALFDNGGNMTLELRDDTNTASSETLYENTPKNRALRSSDFGMNVQGPNTVRSEFYFANNVFTSCELGLSRDELAMLMKQGSTTYFRFRRTKLIDQDDKEVIEYSNAFGQKVATLSYDDNNAKIVTLFGYDSYGNVIKVINPEKQESTYEYNLIGKLVREKTVDAGEKRYMYNKHLQISAIQDQLHRDYRDQGDNFIPSYRSFSYDDYGRLLAQGTAELERIINPQNPGVSPGHYDIFAYEDKIVALPTSDYRFEYVYSNKSSLDWLATYKRKTSNSPYNIITVQVQPVIDVLEKKYEYSIDGTAPTVGKLLTSKSYDISGDMIQQIDYTYDSEDRVASQVFRFDSNGLSGNSSPVATIYYPKYNFRGSLMEEKIDLGSNGTTDMHYHYTYDELNRLVKVAASQGEAVKALDATLLASYEYDNATGLVSFERHHLGQNTEVLKIEQKYDVRDRLKQLSSELLRYDLFYDADQPPGFDGQQVDFGRNFNGNINGISATYQFAGTQNQPSNFDRPTIYGYQYDKLNRLTKADALSGDFIEDASDLQQQESYLIGDERYSYDRIGNIKNLERHKKSMTSGAMAELESWTYAYITGKNRLVTAIGAPGTANRGYTYDANGNLLRDNFKNMDVEFITRGAYPSELKKDNQYITYLYDVNDLRIFKNSTVSGQQQKEYTLKDMMNRDIATYDYNTSSWTFNVYGSALVSRVTAGSGQISNGEATFYVYDHLGNSRVTYQPSAQGTIVNRTIMFAGDYFPYGKVLREFANGEIERYLTTFHDRDQETGLDYRGARYYDSDIARFLSTDPLQNEYPSYSTYNYVMGNPVAFVDPTGMATEDPPNKKLLSTISGGATALGFEFGMRMLNQVDVSAETTPKLTTEEVGAKLKAFTAAIDHSPDNPMNMHSGAAGEADWFWQMFMPLPKVGGFGTLTTNSRVFWSGGAAAKTTAASYAKKEGMKTLEMTMSGRVMNTLNPIIPRSISNPIWKNLSENFARGASGEAHLFTNGLVPKPTSIWMTVEKPILDKSLVNILIH